MRHKMTLFHTMGPNRNILLETKLLFVTIYMISRGALSCLITEDDAGLFESPLFLRIPLYLVMSKIDCC